MKYRVINNENLAYYGVNVGDICTKSDIADNAYYNKNWKDDGVWFIALHKLELFVTNRDKLLQFITKNKIDMKATSLMLGKSKSWLATMCYESKRGDIKQSSLDRIIAALSIDWNSKAPVMVNSKGYVPYKTIPANYSRTQDKARLMKSYLNGEVK